MIEIFKIIMGVPYLIDKKLNASILEIKDQKSFV